MISFDDFQKLDLRVAQVKEAERVEKSDKLIRLIVNLGEEERQILAGIGKAYRPEELVGKKLAIVANLETKMMLGYESQGMVLAADLDGVPSVLFIDDNILPGSVIR